MNTIMISKIMTQGALSSIAIFAAAAVYAVLS
jgi:hypothetical protein